MLLSENDKSTVTMVMFFILPCVTRANLGIVLDVLFYQPGKENLAKISPGW